MKLEICCYHIQDVFSAIENGADRIEFCSGHSDGGLTPSYGDLYQLSQLNLPIPIHIMVRPRGGDFCYDSFEVASMLHDIELIKKFNFAGVVLGCLLPNGKIDLSTLKTLVNASEGLSITFHRAFDVCSNPILALKQINNFNIHRLLTSGQQSTATDGIALLDKLNQQTDSTIIMPGCGIRSSNIDQFIKLQFKEVHSSASICSQSPMQYRNITVNMSQHGRNEFIRYAVDGQEVNMMKQKLRPSTNM